MEAIRNILFSEEFELYYNNLESKIKEKYNYALNIVRTQKVVNTKFVKRLGNTDFYELRISISTDEYRTILFAIDNDNFIESNTVILLNSFLKKNTKQYKSEIQTAEKIIKRYMEDWLCWNWTRINWEI